MSEYRASMIETPEAMYNWILLNSNCRRLIAHIAVIKPIVPKARTGGKFFTVSSPAFSKET
ncbi:hypothetical protein D3C78_1763270 [compost metagenome]